MRYRSAFQFSASAAPIILSLGAQAVAATAEPAEQPPLAEEADSSAIVVTGLRGAPRTVAESPAPIDVVSADKLQGTGAAEFGEALSKLLPSLNFGATHAGVFSIGRAVTNRGLGPAYTLVLVNGKRRHNGAFLNNSTTDTSGIDPVDLYLIPRPIWHGCRRRGYQHSAGPESREYEQVIADRFRAARLITAYRPVNDAFDPSVFAFPKGASL